MGNDRALVKNAADPEQVKAAEKRERARESRLLEQYGEVMATPAGRAVMWDLIGRCGVFRSSWHPSAAIHFNEGRRDVGLELMAKLLSVSDELYLEMEREGRQAMKIENAKIDSARVGRANNEGE